MEYIYSLAFGLSMASATLRRWIFPVAVLGICDTIQTCKIRMSDVFCPLFRMRKEEC